MLTRRKKTAFSLAVAAGFIVAAEGAVRLRYPASMVRPEPADFDPGPQSTVPYRSRCIAIHPQRGYALVPSCDDPEYDGLHVNSLGFKGKEFQRTKPNPSIVRIFCLGNSTTVSPHGCSYDIPLDALLNESGEGPGYEVVNAGLHGYASFQSLSWVKNEILDLEPDVFVFFHMWNDMDIPSPPADVQTDLGFVSSLEPRIWLRSYLVNYVRLFLWRDLNNALAIRRLAAGPRSHARLDYPRSFADTILELERISDERGIGLVLVTQPSLVSTALLERRRRDADFLGRMMAGRIFMPPWYDSLEEYVAKAEYFNSVVRELAEREGLPLLDMERIVERTYTDEQRLDHFPSDMIHFDCEVHARIAEGLKAIILGMRGLAESNRRDGR